MNQIMKKSIILAVISFVVIIAVIFSIQAIQTPTNEKQQGIVQDINVDVFMPTKSSRPGCEQTDSCYIPSVIEIQSGESVTWQNQDVAFHSITSGSYDNPEELFDSGHLDPNQSFTFKFDESGDYDYFCTLHPWMKGKVLVK